MFDAIGKGHIILHGEDRMQNKLVFRNGDGSEAIIPADLLPESQRDGRQMVDAVEVVKHLVQRVRELEKQRDWLAKKCEDLSDDPEDFFMPYNIPAGTWIERAEQATKEAE